MWRQQTGAHDTLVLLDLGGFPASSPLTALRLLFQIVIEDRLRFHHGRGHALSYDGFEVLAFVLVVKWIVAQVCRLIAAGLRLGRFAEASFLGGETCLRVEEGEGGCADGWAEGFEDRRSCKIGSVNRVICETRGARVVHTGPEDPPRWKVEAHNVCGCSIGERRLRQSCHQ